MFRTCLFNYLSINEFILVLMPLNAHLITSVEVFDDGKLAAVLGYMRFDGAVTPL